MPSIFDYVRTAFAEGATDLILAEDHPPRVRINGEIVSFESHSLTHDEVALFWKEVGADPISDQEKDLGWTAEDGSRLRVNLFKCLGTLCAVLRPIKRDVPDFQQLGLPSPLLMSWLSRRSGLIIVSGPTGCGKSTSVASCLDWINHHHRRHIVTIEDPVEYLFENDLSHFSQREVGPDTTSFSGALRAALRQSPDIIFLGEIRDEDTALIALRAAETGHLVLATLHSPGVAESLERLGNLSPPTIATPRCSSFPTTSSASSRNDSCPPPMAASTSSSSISKTKPPSVAGSVSARTRKSATCSSARTRPETSPSSTPSARPSSTEESTPPPPGPPLRIPSISTGHSAVLSKFQLPRAKFQGRESTKH